MGLPGWILFLIAAIGAAGYATYTYRRRELPGRGRSSLAVLRALALALLLLVLFDPQLPDRDRAAARRAPVVLLDGSLSMSLPAAAGGTRFDAAREEARRVAGNAPVLVFEQTTRVVAPAALAAEAPGDGGARLLPALRAAAESGARRAVVVTDGRIVDAAEVARWLPALQLDVEFRYVDAAATANRGLVEVQAPSWAESGAPFEIRFGVAAAQAVGDSVLVRVTQDGRPLTETRIALPDVARIATGTLSIQPEAPPGGGYVRLQVALEPGDAIPDDDRRDVYVYVSDEPTGVALLSFTPDWEVRFLAPVLAQALGLPVRGYLHLGAEGYRATGTGLAIGAAASEDEVRRAAGRADLLVLHGMGGNTPDWARELAARHARVIVITGGGAGDVGLPIEPGPSIVAEWYPAAEPPSSPVAPLLAGVDAVDAPPLTALRPVAVPPGGWVALEATRGRQGAPLPAAVAGESASRRWVLAPGDGYWRWSFRGDASRQLYTRFWGALAGWLVRERATVDGAQVRPLHRVVERGGVLRWSAPGVAADSFAVRLVAEDGSARDTVLSALRGDSVAQPSPPPGRYTYEVDAYAAGERVASGTGEISVETYSPDFMRPRAALEDLAGAPGLVGPRAELPGRPLRAMAAPYIVIMLLLAAEWVLRRRWGLR